MEFDKMSKEELESYIASHESELELSEAKWTTKYMNSLPDGSFALVKTLPNGKKLRALPYKDGAGNIDKAHLRNALARWNQVQGFSPEDKAAALKKLRNAAKSVGIGVQKGNSNQSATEELEVSITEKTIKITELESTIKDMTSKLVESELNFKNATIDYILLAKEDLMLITDKEKARKELETLTLLELAGSKTTLNEELSKIERKIELKKTKVDETSNNNQENEITLEEQLLALLDPKIGKKIVKSKLS